MIAIPNMEKPKTCFSCSFNDGLFCSLIDDDSDALLSDKPAEEISTRRLDACPLTEIDIVRCGECKWWKPLKYWDGRIAHNCIWMACNLPKNEYDFCSYGERRE